MNEFNSIIKAALAESIGFLGETVIIGGKPVQGIVNEIAFSEEYMDGGRLKQTGLTVVAQLPETPKIGSKVLYKGKSFRILEINEDVGGTEIVCESDAK